MYDISNTEDVKQYISSYWANKLTAEGVFSSLTCTCAVLSIYIYNLILFKSKLVFSFSPVLNLQRKPRINKLVKIYCFSLRFRAKKNTARFWLLIFRIGIRIYMDGKSRRQNNVEYNALFIAVLAEEVCMSLKIVLTLNALEETNISGEEKIFRGPFFH